MSNSLNFCQACGGKLEEFFIEPDDKLAPYHQCTVCLENYYNNPTVGVAVIHLINDKKKILLGKRKSSYRANLWCIPCGHLDAYEPVADGAKRELLEETSLIAHDLKLFEVSTNPNNTVGVYFIATNVSGRLQASDDLSEVAYFDMDELPNMAFVSDLTIINKLKAQNE